MKRLLICSLLMAFMFSIQAQRGYEIGGWLGSSVYFGDLNTTFRFNSPGVAGGLIGRYDMNNRMAIKFSANYGSIRANDADSENTFERARNLSFKSNILEGTLQYEFNFFPYIHGSDDYFFTPYLFGGLTGFYFEPKAKIDGEYVKLRPLGTEGQANGQEYSPIQMALAYGFGVKFDLSYEWSVNVELSARSLFTDYLDDVSTKYPDFDALTSSRGPLATRLSDRSGEILPIPIGEPGRQRGNVKDKDSYNFISIGLVYYIGILECPDISRPKF